MAGRADTPIEWRGAIAVPLPDGRVVVLPRWGQFSLYRDIFEAPRLDDPASRTPVDVFDPVTGVFSTMGTIPAPATAAIALRTGEVLVVGHGLADRDGSSWTRPTVSTWSATLDPASGRLASRAAPRAVFPSPAGLADGRVLLVGGWDPSRRDENDDPVAVPWVDVFE